MVANSTPNERHLSDSVSMRIVQRVASVDDWSKTQIPPLYDVIDPKALDALVESAVSGSAMAMEFEYAGRRVTVAANGDVSVA